MVKGVNKLIVEVANPDSEFFERAIFFVKPQMKDTPPKELGKSADSLICSQGTKAFRGKRRKARIPRAVAFAGTAGLGAAIAAIVLWLLG